jgi:hypothetical protein
MKQLKTCTTNLPKSSGIGGRGFSILVAILSVAFYKYKKLTFIVRLFF